MRGGTGWERKGWGSKEGVTPLLITPTIKFATAVAKVQNSTFSMPHSSSSDNSEGITEYCDQDFSRCV